MTMPPYSKYLYTFARIVFKSHGSNNKSQAVFDEFTAILIALLDGGMMQMQNANAKLGCSIRLTHYYILLLAGELRLRLQRINQTSN